MKRLALAVLISPALFAQLPVTVQQGGNTANVTASGAVKVDGSGATQPISGTVGVSGSVAVTGTFWQATQPVSLSSLPILSAGTNIIGKVGIDQTTPGTTNGVVVNNASIPVTGTFWQTTQPVSIASSVAVTGTFWQATQPISAASLPLPSGAATSAKQPALGTAGTASTDVLTVQGIASMTALKVDGSAVTQPVSGTVSISGTPAVSQSGTWNVGITGTPAVSQSGTWNVGITGTVVDPCAANAKSFAPINLTANTQIITGTASKKTYVCSINIVAGAATNVALVEGTGTTCATGIAGMAGGSTAATGWNFAANGGLVEGSGMASVMATATAADNVCILVSAANQVSGAISYVQQ